MDEEYSLTHYGTHVGLSIHLSPAFENVKLVMAKEIKTLLKRKTESKAVREIGTEAKKKC